MNEPTSISVSFVNELEDHLEARRVVYSRGFLYKVDKVVAVLLVGFGICGVVFAGWQWWTIIWFPLAVAEWFDVLSLERWRTKIEFQRNPKFREKYHLTFSRENIRFTTVSIDATLQWTHYERVIESRDLFLLMYGKGLYTLIPKRCFSSGEEMNAFRILVNQTIA